MKHRFKFTIASVIVGIHLFFAILAFLTPIQRTLPRKQLVVKAITYPHPPSLVVASPSPALQVKKPIPPKPSSSTPKLSSPSLKPSVKKKAQVTPSATNQKKEKVSQPRVPSHLLKELEETLAKIEAKPQKPAKNHSPALKQEPLHSEKAFSAQSRLSHLDQQELLISHLRHSLHLPDFGEVKIELILSSEGVVKSLRVLRAESRLNREYLEKQLPLLHFPPLNLTSEKREATFILTFCNEL